MASLTGFFGSSNFGQSMDLSEYMEGYPEGFSITDQDTPFHEENGEIIGYRTEEKNTEQDWTLQELESVYLEETPNGATPPQEVEIPIIFGVFKKRMEEGFSFEESFRRAAWTYTMCEMEYNAQVQVVTEAIRQLHSQQNEDSDLGKFLWIVDKLLGNLPEKPEPVVLKREPVIEDQHTQMDERTTLCRLFDSIDWQYRMDNIRAARAHEYCFRVVQDDEGNESIEKVLSDEEIRYLSRKKTEREERTQRILDWIQRATKRRVTDAFGQGGVFWDRLNKSRTECLSKSGAGLKTPTELYLTKAQVDTILAVVRDKLGWKRK